MATETGYTFTRTGIPVQNIPADCWYSDERDLRRDMHVWDEPIADARAPALFENDGLKVGLGGVVTKVTECADDLWLIEAEFECPPWIAFSYL